MPRFRQISADDVVGPRLLVSVRDCAEAQAALDGGADIIDVKNPETGPLGFAGFEAIGRISKLIKDHAPVSAAFGECSDWQQAVTEKSRVPQKPLQHRPSLGKLGLAHLLAEPQPTREEDFSTILKRMQTAPPPWVASWQSVRHQLKNCVLPDECRQTAVSITSANVAGQNIKQRKSGWVAVAYADNQRACAPNVWSVLAAGVQTGCSILLIDTFVKDGQGTLTWLDVPELQKIRAITRQMGLQLALAGQLSDDHLPAVANIQPDIFAVRGAVCAGMDRQAAVSADRVRRLQEQLIQTTQAAAEERD